MCTASMPLKVRPGSVETLRVGATWQAAERFLDLPHACLTAAAGLKGA